MGISLLQGKTKETTNSFKFGRSVDVENGVKEPWITSTNGEK